MATEDFLAGFVNNFTAKNFTPIIKDGQFSIINRSSATALYSHGDQMSDLRLRTDFQCVGRKKHLDLDPTFHDVNGYNKQYITENGVFNPEAALNQFSKTDFGKRVVGRDIETLVRGLTHRDCHTSYLYNMLISWGKALLYKMNGDTDFELKVKCDPYQSEHVTVGLPDLATKEYTIDIEEPCDAMLAPQLRRDENNYFAKPYVLHYNASTAHQEWFYLMHVPGRTKASALNFDLVIPGIKADSIILDPVNPHANGVDSEAIETVPWDDPDMIWKWIIDYVSLNRIEQQFASTLELFGTMFFHPVWSSAEACQWQISTLHAVLGTFEPTRARLRTVLEGEPYMTDTEAHEYVMRSSVKPVYYLTTSAILNYYMWYGLYSVVYNDAADRDTWEGALSSVADELQMLYTPHMKAFVIGAILNHDIPTNMTHGAGFYVDMHRIAEIEKLANTAPGRSGEHAEVVFDALYAPVSGSMILGTLSGELACVQHLKAVYEVEMNGSRNQTYDVVELTKLATIYRLFGHNVTYFDEVTGKEIKPWASVNECIIEPSSIHFNPKEVKKITIGWSDMRAGRAVPLPALGSLATGGKISIVIQKPHLEIITFRTAQTPVRTYVTSKRGKKPVPIKIKSGYAYRPSTFTARRSTVPSVEGFYTPKNAKVPDAPEGEKVKEPVQTSVSTEAIPDSAGVVGPSTKEGVSRETIPGPSKESSDGRENQEQASQS